MWQMDTWRWKGNKDGRLMMQMYTAQPNVHRKTDYTEGCIYGNVSILLDRWPSLETNSLSSGLRRASLKWGCLSDQTDNNYCIIHYTTFILVVHIHVHVRACVLEFLRVSVRVFVGSR